MRSVVQHWFLSLAKKEFRAKLTSKESLDSGESEVHSKGGGWADPEVEAEGQGQGCLVF